MLLSTKIHVVGIKYYDCTRGSKKKILGREVKELFSVNQWDSEAHFRSFYCVFFLYV